VGEWKKERPGGLYLYHNDSELSDYLVVVRSDLIILLAAINST
jgi:hypothetical protein